MNRNRLESLAENLMKTMISFLECKVLIVKSSMKNGFVRYNSRNVSPFEAVGLAVTQEMIFAFPASFSLEGQDEIEQSEGYKLPAGDVRQPQLARPCDRQCGQRAVHNSLFPPVDPCHAVPTPPQ